MTPEELTMRLDRIERLIMEMKPSPLQREFYSTAEVAERLGLSKWYVRRLCSLGQILAEKHPDSGRYLVSASELERVETRRDAL